MVGRPRGHEPLVILSFLSLGHYRKAPMQLILESFKDRATVYAGISAVDSSIKTLTPEDIDMKPLRTFSLGRFILQAVPPRRYLNVPILVVDLNPNAVHLWPLLFCRRLFRRPTVVWGHAWPRGGMNSRTASVRLAMARLAHTTIVYTRSQVAELQERAPRLVVRAAPNSLYLASEYGFDSGADRTDFIYVGRLVPEKKVGLLVKAFSEVVSAFPEARLHIVGDGPSACEVRELIHSADLEKFVQMHGHVDDVSSLRSLYRTCVAAVSPGYVGLSATQSFSFGVPMIVAKDEPHAPEIEAVKQGVNAKFFESDSAQSLAKEMVAMFNEREHWRAVGDKIAKDCRDEYSAEAMASGVVEAIISAGSR